MAWHGISILHGPGWAVCGMRLASVRHGCADTYYCNSNACVESTCPPLLGVVNIRLYEAQCGYVNGVHERKACMVCLLGQRARCSSSSSSSCMQPTNTARIQYAGTRLMRAPSSQIAEHTHLCSMMEWLYAWPRWIT